MTLPVPALSKFLATPSHLAVVAAKFSYGAPRVGAEHGPTSLIQSGVFSDIQSNSNYVFSFDEPSSHHINDPSDDSKLDGMKQAQKVSLAAKSVSDCVYNHARQGKFVMTLGGDHSIGMGTLTGIARAVRERHHNAELSVMWIDAHADVNSPETSLSGRIHGMPVSFASGLSRSRIFDWVTDSHLVNMKKFVYIGLRDVDEAEKAIIRDNSIKAFTMDDVKRNGIQTVMNEALDYLGNESPIHLSYDIDSLDPEWAPSTGFPVSQGLSLQEGIHISQRLHAHGNLISMDLVEINPLIMPSELDKTLSSAGSIITTALGLGKGHT